MLLRQMNCRIFSILLIRLTVYFLHAIDMKMILVSDL